MRERHSRDNNHHYIQKAIHSLQLFYVLAG